MDVQISEAGGPKRRARDLHARLCELLAALDQAELYGAAAYVSMASDAICRDYPELSATR